MGFRNRVGEIIDVFCHNVDGARVAERHAMNRFAGTRVVEVARRMFEDKGRDLYLFWYPSSSDRERFFEEAIRQLKADSNSWGSLYKWKRRLQRALKPISWALDFINQNTNLPFDWNGHLYIWSHWLDWNTGNWNVVREF